MNQENRFLLLLLGATAAGITITGILFHQNFLRILPLYISLIIALLQSGVNRYAPMIGGINSVLYGFVYMHYHLYGSAAYAFLVSCPVQIVTFILWQRKKWGSSTIFRKMNLKQRIFTAAAFGIALLGIQFVLSQTDADYIFLDSMVTLLGILISFLTMFACIEYTGLMLISGIINVILYLNMMQETPEQITYLVFSLYSLICQCLAYRKANMLYLQQQKEQKQ